MRAWTVVVLTLACGATLVSAHRVVHHVRQLEPERQELYKWFDSLGFTDRMRNRFGEIEMWNDFGQKPLRIPSTYGFLETGDGKTFKALTLSLDTMQVTKGRDGSQQSFAYSFRSADLKKWLVARHATWLELEAHPPGWPDNGPRVASFGYGFGDEFIIARVADLYGHDDLATWYYAQSKKYSYGGYMSEGADYATRLKNDIARQFFERDLWSVNSGSLSRSGLLSKMSYLVDHFPSSAVRTQAESYVATLERMAKEDASRKPITDTELKSLSDADKARELVWQLRNQTGRQWMNPGSTDIFGFGQGNSETPADKLVKLGIAAVPALIDALSDKTFTRAVLSEGMGPPSRMFLVRDAALQILNKIASHGFAEREYVESDAAGKVIKSHVVAWWTSIKKLGEERVLVNAVSHGDGYSDEQADRLAEAYPRSALAAVKAGVKNSKVTAVRSSLIRSLKPVVSPDVLAFAKDQMRHAPDLETRLSAAEVVQRYEPETAAIAMASEWRKIHRRSESKDDLQEFLIATWRPVAFRALTQTLTLQSDEDRARFVTGTFDETYPEASEPRLSRKQRLETDQIVETALAGELTDHGRWLGMGGSFGGFEVKDPQICELAAYGLAQLRPTKYRFRKETDPGKLDEMCRINLNIWRKSKGLTPVPRPSAPVVKEASAQAMDPLFTAVRAGNPHFSDWEKVGLSGLKPLVRFSRSLTGSKLKAADAIEGRLSNIVREVRVRRAPSGARSFIDRVRALRSKELTPTRFQAILEEVVRSWPGGCGGALISVEKRGDGAGVVLTVDLGVSPLPYTSGQVDYQHRIVVAGKSILDGETGGDRLTILTDERLAIGVKKALSAPPFTPFSIDVALHRCLKTTG